MKKSRHRVSKKEALKAIASALEGIESEFEWQGFSSQEQATDQPEALPDAHVEGKKEEEQESEEDGGDEEEEGDEYIGSSSFDAEGIEVAIDVFTSELIRAGVISKAKLGKGPSFSGVFESFFGTDHEIVQLATSFEEYAEGYFGFISYDNMSAAHETLLQIKGIIAEESKN